MRDHNLAEDMAALFPLLVMGFVLLLFAIAEGVHWGRKRRLDRNRKRR